MPGKPLSRSGYYWKSAFVALGRPSRSKTTPCSHPNWLQLSWVQDLAIRSLLQILCPSVTQLFLLRPHEYESGNSMDFCIIWICYGEAVTGCASFSLKGLYKLGLWQARGGIVICLQHGFKLMNAEKNKKCIYFCCWFKKDFSSNHQPLSRDTGSSSNISLKCTHHYHKRKLSVLQKF